VFLTEPRTSDDIREGFVGCKEDSASESDLTFHPWVPERIARPSIMTLPIQNDSMLRRSGSYLGGAYNNVYFDRLVVLRLMIIGDGDCVYKVSSCHTQ